MSNSKQKKPLHQQQQSSISSPSNQLSSQKKQFPSISLSKHLQQYKAYRAIDNKKKFPDLDKNNTFSISPEDKSLLMNRNIQMPSIHNANEMSSIEGYLQTTQDKLQKLQIKVLKSLFNTKRQQEWKLYMRKSQLIHKNQQFEEVEEYLLKFIVKCLDKIVVGNEGNNEGTYNNQTTLLHQTILEEMDHHEGTGDKKVVMFSNSLLQAPGKGISKKMSQPSLRVLKQQHSSTRDTPNPTAFLAVHTETPLSMNKTTVNLRSTRDNAKGQLSSLVQNRYMQQINKMTLQRSLIQKKLQMYESRIGYLQGRLREENISVDGQEREEIGMSQQQQQQSGEAIKPHHPKRINAAQQLLMSNIINQNKYKSQVEVKKMQNQSLTKQLTAIRQFSFKLKIENERLLKLLDQLEKQCNECRQYKRYKELWLMQCEETIGWKSLWKDRKDEAVRLNNKIKVLKQKNKQLLHSFNFSLAAHPDQEQDKQQLQSIIKSFQEWLKVMSIPRVNGTTIDTNSLINDMTITEKQCMPDPDNMNYKLFKPNFFIFFQAYEKTIMMEKNILNTRPLQPSFYVKIRAIFDSLYNHINSYNHYKYWTSFPEFVIGFLEKYEICFATMKLEVRKKPMASEEKLTFLMNLFNKKLSNTLECDIFRSFILEQYALDEIYFFLDCRNDLNGGSALTHGLGTIDSISFVKLSKALATAQRKLYPYQNYIIQRVKTILKSRKVEKYGEMFIDRHFVLRLLLEVYALEKTKSEKIFEASFKNRTNKKANLSYSDYFSFMSKNFDFLTSVDVCELYRETYSLTSGKINSRAVHYICQCRGLFIPLIWSKRLNMNVLEKSLNTDMILMDLQNNARKMDGHLAEFGVEDVGRLENQLNYFLRQLDWYRSNRQVFYFKLQQIKIRIQKANSLLDWQSSTYSPNQLLSSQQIRTSISQLHNLIHESDNSTKFLTNKRQQKDKAMKKIIHNFKIRIQQSMREFKRVDEDQLRKLKEQMAIEIKLREMRMRQELGEEGNQNENGGAGNNRASVASNGSKNAGSNHTIKSQKSVQSKSRHSLANGNNEIAEENDEESDKQL